MAAQIPKSAKSSKPVALSPFRVNHMTLFGKEKLCIPQVLIFNITKCFAIYTTHSGLVSDLFEMTRTLNLSMRAALR